jgi:hypothetical protein
MKTTSLVAALALSFAASGAALAEGSRYDYPQQVPAAKTRAEVVAELRQARADGSLRATEADLQKDTPIASTRSRAEVRAETLAAVKSGEVRELTQDSNAFTIAHAGSMPATAVR